MAKGNKTNNVYVYVFLQEHYHFPSKPDDMNGDMVGCTPMHVCAGTDTGRITLKNRAKELATRLCNNYSMKGKGEVKEHENGNEYRVWVDWPVDSWGYAHADRFVYVVRRVIYTSG